MVVVKVRETYDLCTVKNKMTVIAVHTPRPDIIQRNFPGLLMQCKAYRPLAASVRIACASVEPLDPLGVGTSDGDVAPEDMFNPILYTAMSNLGMSQLEARIASLTQDTVGMDINGATAAVDVDSNTPDADEFPIYYGLLSNAHLWRHAAPQQGLSMENLKPLVYEMLYNVGDSTGGQITQNNYNTFSAPGGDGYVDVVPALGIRGNAKPLPFMNCTSYTCASAKISGIAGAGFIPSTNNVSNSEITTPWVNVCVAGIIIPPSRLHQLYYRMVVEWAIEFTGIRPLSEIMNYFDLKTQGQVTHYQNYNYEEVKKAVTGSDESILDNDTCMVSANVGVNKVM